VKQEAWRESQILEVAHRDMFRGGQSREFTPYMTVHLVIPLPKLPFLQYTLYIYGFGTLDMSKEPQQLHPLGEL
jgi:hypothetical protein